MSKKSDQWRRVLEHDPSLGAAGRYMRNGGWVVYADLACRAMFWNGYDWNSDISQAERHARIESAQKVAAWLNKSNICDSTNVRVISVTVALSEPDIQHYWLSSTLQPKKR